MPLIGASQYYSGFSPTLVPGCALWLDAADSSSLSLSGSNVTAWRDKSGTSRTVTISNTVTYTSATPSVNTSSAGSSRIVANVDLRKSVVRDANIFIVYAWSGFSLNTNQFLWGTDMGGGWNRIQFLSFPDATPFAYNLGYQVASPYSVSVSNMSTSNRLIYHATYSYLTANATGVYINGTLSSALVTEGAAGPETTSTSTVFGAGNLDAGNPMATAQFNEIIVFSNAITPAQRQSIEGYLARKWGLGSNIPATHPFRSLPPFMRAFQPTDISGCTLWLDALDPCGSGVRPGFGTQITTWVDKSGLRNNTTTVSGTITFESNAINTVPALSFSNTFFTGPFATTYTGSNIQAFAVATLDSAGGAYCRILSLGVLGTSDTNNPSSTVMVLRPGPGSTDLQVGRNNVYATAETSGFNIPFIVQSGHSGTTESIGVNGLDPTTADTGTTAGFNIAAYCVGGNVVTTDGSSRWRGYIGEVIYYNTTLSRGQRQQVETYLANKWRMRGSMVGGHYARLSPALGVNFNPLLLSNCGLWLDAADGTSLTMSGSNVVRWNDKSGSNRHAVSTGNPQMGTMTTGRPAVVLSGTNYFDVSGASTLSGGAMTIFAQASATTNGRNLLAMWGNTRVITFQLYYNGNIIFFTSNTLFFNSNATCCIIENPATTTCSSFFNGRTDNTTTASSFTPSTEFVLGANYNYANGWIGNIQEVIIYNRALPAAERQQVEGYLAGKWGLTPTLPAGHPYKSATP